MIGRRRARLVAMQALFQVDSDPSLVGTPLDEFVCRRMRERQLQSYCMRLVEGVVEHRDRIDALLVGASQNWALDRMAAVDRNILRVAVYELLFVPEIPPKVAIDEAIEIAKHYSTAEAPAFINGVLDAIAHAHAVAPAEPVPIEG
jgi:N utilization substance protein B